MKGPTDNRPIPSCSAGGAARSRCSIVAVVFVVMMLLQDATVAPAAPIPIAAVQRAEAVVFEREILPILQRSCLACHSASQRNGELSLESPDAMKKGGDSGPAIVAGNGAQSLLLKLASHADEPVMPPAGNKVNAPPLSSEELGLIRLWIDQGAKGTGGIASLSPKQMQAIARSFAPVLTVAVTADGQYVAASRGNRLYLYHGPSGQRVAELGDPALTSNDPSAVEPVAHRDLVESLAFNVEGDLLASGSFREAKLWRRPRDVQRTQLAVGGPVTALAVSPNLEWIATSGPNNTIRIWNAKSGQPAATLSGHSDRVTGLKFDEQNATLFSVSIDQTLRRWRVADGVSIGLVESPSPLHALEIVEVSPPAANPRQPPIVVTGGADNQIRTWSIPDAAPEKWANGIANARLLAFSRDRGWAAVADTAGTVRLMRAANAAAGAAAGTGAAVNGLTTWATVADWKLDKGSPVAMELAGGSATEPPLLLTASADGTLSAQKIPEQTLLRRWRGALNPVTALAASGDGKLVASGSDKGEISTWKNLFSEPAKVLCEPNAVSGVTTSTWHPARRIAAVAGTVGGRHGVLVRNLDNGQLMHTLLGHDAPVRAVAFSADGQRLVTASDDQTVRVFELNSPQPPESKKFGPAGSPLTAVALSPDSAQLLAAGADNKVRLFNVADGMLQKECMGHGGRIVGAGYLAAGQPYSISADRTVRFWNPADGQQVRAIELPSPIISWSLSVDAQRLAVGCEDKLIRIVLLSNGQIQQTLTGHQGPAVSLNFSADGKRLASSAAANMTSETIVWEIEKSRIQEVLEDVPCSFVTWDGQPDRLIWTDVAGRTWSRALLFWRHCDGNQQAIVGLQFQNASQNLLCAARDGSIRGFNTENAQATFATNHGAPLTSFRLSANEQAMVSGAENGTVRFWQINGGGLGVQQVANLAGPVLSAGYSPDNARVLVSVAGAKPFLAVFDVATGQLLQRFTHQVQPATSVYWMPERDAIVSMAADSIWYASVRSVRLVPGHTGPVNALAAIPGSPLQVFSGSTDTTIRRWNLENAQPIAQFGHGGPVTAVAVRHDAQRLASASDNHTIKLWNINGQQLVEMRGDLRRKNSLARLTQQQAAANERLNYQKQQADIAEKDVPLKTDAAQKATAALTAANTDLQQKQTALTQAADQKLAAEKASIAASAEARKAQIAKSTSEQSMKDMDSELQVAQQKAALRTTASNAAPNDAGLKQAAAEAAQLVVAAQQKLQAAQTAVQTSTQSAQAMANLANEAAQKVATTQKPYNDALAAVRSSQAAQRLAMQQSEIASKELEQANARLPVARAAVTKAEANLAELKKLVEAATAAVNEADQAVRTLSFSADGRFLASAGDFASAHLWDGETGIAIAAFAGHKAPLSGVAFLGHSEIVSASADQTAVVWDLHPAWKLEKTIGAVDKPEVISHRVMSVDFSADSTRLLVGSGVPSRNGELHVFNLADGARVQSIAQAHDDVVHAARFSPDGKRIASAGADRYVRTFDAATAQPLRRFEGHTNYVLSVAWKSDSQTLVSAGADNVLKVWDAETGDQRVTIPNFGKHATGVRFIGDSDNVVSSCGDRQVRMHVASNGGNFRNFGGANAWIHAVDITPNLELLAAGTADGSLVIWNGNNGQLVRTVVVGK